MPTVAHRFHLLTILLLTALALAGCKNSTAENSVKKDSNTPTATAPAEDKAVEDIPADIYPGFPLAALKPAERAQIVKVTRAELCPCDDSTESLHQCLQSKESRCALAEQSLNMIGAMVRGSYNETDILDEVATFVEAAKKTHQFRLENRAYKGNVDAKVVIVEFADFECPHCRTASGIMKSISEKYGDEIVLYFKQYPLPSHANAEIAARAAVAANNQGKFWPMHDEIFKNQRALSYDKIVGFGQRLGLNIGKFKTDMESPDVRQIVADDRADGDAAGITGTPSFFINGKRHLGDSSEAALIAAIDAALAEAKAADTTTN